MIDRTARLAAQQGHRLLLVIWRFLPLQARRLAIRVLYPRFPVGAIAIVRDGAGRVLLVRQTYHREGVRWAAPGGWMARGESPRRAAERETREEAGLAVKAGRLLVVDGGPYGEISLAFECRIVEDTGFRPSEETDQIGYFPPSDLPPMTIDTRRLLLNALDVQSRWQAVEDYTESRV
jgi:8-oxo-dGTP diphosphatase